MARLAPLALAALLLSLAYGSPAAAAPYLPPEGVVLHGVSGTSSTSRFAEQTGKRPAVHQMFVAWDDAEWAFNRAAGDMRLMLHVSTNKGEGTPERITPRQIAQGKGDAFLERLNRRILERDQPVYIRLMAEMNGHWNAYSAFDASGRARPGHSTADFRRAWRRATRILRRGGAKVAMMWVPQMWGSPNTPANAPDAYWPGGRYVDWVGVDFYSRFPHFAELDAFYRKYKRKPFVFGEYALWGRDDPSFVRRLFAFTRSHPRVRMMIYNEGARDDGPFRLNRYPRSRRTLQALLRSPRYPGAGA